MSNLKMHCLYAELVGIALRSHREILELPQSTICEVLGVTSSTYSRYECGETSLSVVQLRSMCSVLPGINPVMILSEASISEEYLTHRGIKVVSDASEVDSDSIPLTGKGLISVIKSMP